MNEKKNYYYVPALIGGILTLIALLTPATYLSQYSEYFYVWMWGLLTYRYYDVYYMQYYSGVSFTSNPIILITSIVCSLFVLAGGIALIGQANQNREGKKGFHRVRNTWIATSILLIIVTAAWMIIYDVSFITSWWAYYNAGFGVIGIFLGAIITIIGTGISNYMIRQRKEVIIPYKQQLAPKITQTQPATTLNFCPMCGKKIADDQFRFCTECGYEFARLSSKEGNFM